MIPERGGWYNLPCWNGLSDEQQRRLIEVGNLPFGFTSEGRCQRGAAVAVETAFDAAPGPRFYCVECAVEYLTTTFAPDAQPPARRCGSCLSVVGVDIMPDEMTPEGICFSCFLEREHAR